MFGTEIVEDPADTYRNANVESDGALESMEKETVLNIPNDTDHAHVRTEVPTVIKWVLSVEESDLQWVRLNGSGAIVAVAARIPKGIIKLQGSARKSNQHSQMVSYGNERGGE